MTTQDMMFYALIGAVVGAMCAVFFMAVGLL